MASYVTKPAEAPACVGPKTTHGHCFTKPAIAPAVAGQRCLPFAQ